MAHGLPGEPRFRKFFAVSIFQHGDFVSLCPVLAVSYEKMILYIVTSTSHRILFGL